MKKVLSAIVAGTILVTAAAPAMAQPRHRDGYSRNYDHRRDNTGAAIGLGLGLFALGAIIASSQDRYQPRYVPPPPRYGYGYGRPAYGYSYGYNDGYYYGR